MQIPVTGEPQQTILSEPDGMRGGVLDASRLEEIMQEITTAHDCLSGVGPAVSFFGSARISRDDPDYDIARRTARLLSREGFAIISGGGPGMMEAVNQGAQEGGSASVGLNIRLSERDETPNPYQDIRLDFRHFFVRKMIFVHFASAFVVLPGGLGTLDEVLECLTLMQTGKLHRIPVILVNRSFWGGMVDWFRMTLLERGTIAERDLTLFRVLDRPEEIRDAVIGFHRGGRDGTGLPQEPRIR